MDLPELATAHAGAERRKSPRLPTKFPIRLRFDSADMAEWFAFTQNVSSEGLLIASSSPLPVGTEVRVSVAVPLDSSTSIPAAQLDGCAVVLRSEQAPADTGDDFPRRIALRFLEKPVISTGLSMFE